MKNIFLIITILGLSIPFAHAQKPRGPVKEKIKALQVAVFTEELDLTSKEAQKFWPIYNEFEEKRKSLNKELRAGGKKDVDGMTDKEIEKFINSRFELEEQKLKLEKEYYKKFKKVLPIKKVAKIPAAERKFKVTLMKKTREMHQRRGGRPNGF